METIRTPGTVCGRTKGTWGDESSSQTAALLLKEAVNQVLETHKHLLTSEL